MKQRPVPQDTVSFGLHPPPHHQDRFETALVTSLVTQNLVSSVSASSSGSRAALRA
jgi:hypothetical protein